MMGKKKDKICINGSGLFSLTLLSMALIIILCQVGVNEKLKTETLELEAKVVELKAEIVELEEGSRNIFEELRMAAPEDNWKEVVRQVDKLENLMAGERE